MILVTWTEEETCDFNTYYDKRSKECDTLKEAKQLVTRLKDTWYVSNVVLWDKHEGK